MASSGYTAISFVANEQPTTAKWNLIGSNDASFNNGNGFEDSIIVNRHIAAAALYASKFTNPYKFEAKEYNGQAVGAGTTVIFNTENFDTGGNYNNATGIFTAPVTGYYAFNANLMYINLSAQTVWGNWVKNGAVYSRWNRFAAVNDVWGCSASILVQLNAGDTFSVQSNVIGTTRNLETGWSYFSGFLVAAA